MKKIFGKKLSLILFLGIFSAGFFRVFAEDLTSNNYKIDAFTVGSGGDVTVSNNYQAFVISGQALNDDRFGSSTYSLTTGFDNIIETNIPKVTCFETSTDGSTNCEDPDIVPNGMVQICGAGGCYDKAHFEIDSQNNPSDTLYSAQIKKAYETDWSYIDGTTFLIEDAFTHDIYDYQTESNWENIPSNFNIIGLEPGTDYELRLTALKGDFTESSASPIASASTSLPSISFDIDIANTDSDNSAPYSLNIGTLYLGSVTTAEDKIWIDFGTNVSTGVNVYVRDSNNGLFSASKNYTLLSQNADLSSTPGFGLTGNSTAQMYLGPVVFENDFNGAGDVVGEIPNDISAKSIANSSNEPLYDGRASIFVKARPNENTPEGNDYTDTITFTVGSL